MIGRGGFVRRRYGRRGLGQDDGSQNVPGSGSITFGGDAGAAAGGPASGAPAAGSVAPPASSTGGIAPYNATPGTAGPYSCTALGTDATSMFICAYWPFLALGAVLFIVGMRARK